MKNELLASAKITSKGQITVPKNIRELLEVSYGDSIVFYKDGNNIHIINKNEINVSPKGGQKSVLIKGGKK